LLPGVSKTAILTLRARVDEHAREDRVLVDPLAAEWWTRVEWPAELDPWYATQTGLAFRADDIDRIIRRFAELEPLGTVVELGAGLSTRRSRLEDLAIERWVDVDLPAVVGLRRAWNAGGDQIAASVTDYAWMDTLSGPQIFIAEGLLYYLPRAEVDALFAELRRRFAGSIVIMDVLGRLAYPQLLEVTRALGAPVQWKHEDDFDRILESHGLETVEGFEPARLTEQMVARYWHRFDNKTRGAIFCSQALMDRRSGVAMGRI